MKFSLLFSLLLVGLFSCDWDLEFKEPPDSGPNCEECKCGEGYSIIDERDGKVYETSWIGGRCWMAENLNYGEFIDFTDSPIGMDSIAQKYCFENDPTMCFEYGGYYIFNEAVNYDPLISTGVKIKGICPNGWHLPSKEEFEVLQDAANAEGSNIWILGTDSTNFSAKLSGFWVDDVAGISGHQGDPTPIAVFWSSTPSSSTEHAWHLFLSPENPNPTENDLAVRDLGSFMKKHGGCVRCIREN